MAVLRYKDIKRSIAGVSSTNLPRALAILESKGFVVRQVEDTTPPSVSHSLTEKGKQMEKLIGRMIELGEVWQLDGANRVESRGKLNNYDILSPLRYYTLLASRLEKL